MSFQDHPTTHTESASSSGVENSESITPAEIIDSKLEIHKYCLEYSNEEKVFILVILYRNEDVNAIQAWIWIGSHELPTFKFLSLAMQNRFVSLSFLLFKSNWNSTF